MATRAEMAARAVPAKHPFEPQFADLCGQITRGLGDMTASNAGFRVEQTSPLSLVIHTGAAGREFVFTADPLTRKVCFVSPKNGMFYYVWDPTRQAWVHETDSHYLIELFTRDLIYYCKGYPTF